MGGESSDRISKTAQDTIISNMYSNWIVMIGDLWSIHLAIMGILVSVITLLYASLCSKVEELDGIKNSTDFVLMNRATAIRNSIMKLRNLNKHAMCGIIITFCLFVLTTILKYLPESCIINCLEVCDAFFTICLIVYGFYLGYGVYSHYQKETI